MPSGHEEETNGIPFWLLEFTGERVPNKMENLGAGLEIVWVLHHGYGSKLNHQEWERRF